MTTIRCGRFMEFVQAMYNVRLSLLLCQLPSLMNGAYESFFGTQKEM